MIFDPSMEIFSLKLNNFLENQSKNLSLLRLEELFCDVTLVTDDEKQISAHKLILAASSQYFKNLFTSNPNSSNNLNGVHSKYLNHVLNYIYKGEVEVLQDDLDTFMNIAHQLKVNGLFKDQEAESKDNDYLT